MLAHGCDIVAQSVAMATRSDKGFGVSRVSALALCPLWPTILCVSASPREMKPSLWFLRGGTPHLRILCLIYIYIYEVRQLRQRRTTHPCGPTCPHPPRMLARPRDNVVQCCPCCFHSSKAFPTAHIAFAIGSLASPPVRYAGAKVAEGGGLAEGGRRNATIRPA